MGNWAYNPFAHSFSLKGFLSEVDSWQTKSKDQRESHKHRGKLPWNLKNHLFEKDKNLNQTSIFGFKKWIFQGVVLLFSCFWGIHHPDMLKLLFLRQAEYMLL